MTDAASLLARLGEPGELFHLAVVESLTDDDRANLSLGDAVLPDVPCLKSYTDRAAGDHVLVINFRAGRLILGAIDHE